ncbi:MAG TPA: ABC transporter permease [Bryobacteraceae bacterium]|nr:ABC transporter permease [Bryobacteraceae bacterium]
MDPIVLKSLLRDVGELTVEHLVLVLISSACAIAIGVSVGIVATRHPAVRRISVTVASILQTIPSLALFGFLLPIPLIGGIGNRTAIICLVLYSLLPILRNTIVGIASVDAPVREAAIAMGMTDGQLLRLVELPLAAPTIIAGIRIAVVTTIGTAVIAAVIGGGGLGVLVFRGLASVDTLEILAGAVPAALLAILADAGISFWERRLTRR